MAFDAVAVRCLVKDLKDKLINSRIDKIHQPEKDEITINLRTMTDNFKLVLSASPAHPRVHFTNVSKPICSISVILPLPICFLKSIQNIGALIGFFFETFVK